jgi:hypothetical protein
MIREGEADGKKVAKLADIARTFKPGETLELSDEELLGLNITVAKFLDNLFRAVNDYGTSQLGEANG